MVGILKWNGVKYIYVLTDRLYLNEKYCFTIYLIKIIRLFNRWGARKVHYNIGYTNGVFDLFHIGHLEFLKKAKEHCNYLIVAVCKDELVYDYKGKYPIVPLQERMELLSGIKYVDKVVIQATSNKIYEWNKYHFDVIFHGIDGKEWDIQNGYHDALKKKLFK